MYSSNISYWNTFYNKHSFNNLKKSSNFCDFVMDYFKNESIFTVLDCGCGNGRDSFKLAEKYIVTGIDNSGYIPNSHYNCTFLNENFVEINKSLYNLIYSRFSFHSISNQEQEVFLESIKNNSYLAIETRSDIDSNNIEYFGKTHYRNYTNSNYLKDLLLKYNFEIMYFYEGKDVAIFENENPTCIRVICKKHI